MKIDAVHPLYSANIDKWRRCRDCYNGQDAVKDRREQYLPRISPAHKTAEYDAYLQRALYFEAVGRTIDGFVGAISRKPHQVTLPDRATYLVQDISGDGVGFNEFSKKLAAETLLTGRAGLMIDWDNDAQRPFVSIYCAEQILNWSPGRVVLSETVYEPDPTNAGLRPVVQLREMQIVDGAYTVTIWRKPSAGPGRRDWIAETTITPTSRGRALEVLPWVWVSTMGAADRIERPPLLGLVNVSLSHYLNSASLEHGRHFCGIPTLYMTGSDPGEDPVRVGGGALIQLKDPNAKVGYAEFSGHGLKSLETALESKQSMMAAMGAAVFGAPRRQAEAAETARIRTAAEHSLLMGVISSVEESLTSALRVCVRWLAEPDRDISVKLNRDLADIALDPQTLTAMVAALQAGAIRLETFLYGLDQAELLPPGTDIDLEAERLRAA